VSWPTGRDDRAVDGRNQTVYFGVFDFSNLPASARNNLNGMSVTTNAQRFSTPSVVNQSLRLPRRSPERTTAGSTRQRSHRRNSTSEGSVIPSRS